MKKSILSITLLATAIGVTGCSTTNKDMWTEFSNILTDAVPFLNESEDWEKYGINVAQQGVVYSAATTSDMQFVSKKMDAEYAAAVSRLATPFARKPEHKAKFDQENQGYVFKYNKVMVVKDKKTSNVLGYCVNYDRSSNIPGQATKQDDNLIKQFIYLAKDRPLSVSTATSDFTKRVCGTEFYTKYKDPKA